MQFPAVAKPPVGILFDTALDRIDEVLALALLHGLEGKGDAHIAAVCVSRPDLAAARFCDTLSLFYASATTGAAAMFMHRSPIGLADGKAAATPAMLSGPFAPASLVKSIDDTADPATLMRNELMAQYDQNAAIVLSGPSADLARLLGMYGVKDWITRKVRLLCMTGQATPIADWPTPVVTVGPEIGEALPFPGGSMAQDFAYAPAHPVVAAYRAYKTMPYDAPSCAMAAMLYAARPNENYFGVSGGKLVFDPRQKERVVTAYVELASAKPVPRKPHRPPANEKKKDEPKRDESKPAASQDHAVRF
ncbi:MAG TPA: hypothetical protein VMI94_24595 [Bryobacteraceae bacterium]|nr:hypothetical protein [Bryobacteraceae bacterium]